MIESLTEVLQAAIDRGMVPPLIVCGISPNGSLIALRVAGGEPDVLAEHYESEAFQLPMTVVVLDQQNEAMRVTIEPGGKKIFH